MSEYEATDGWRAEALRDFPRMGVGVHLWRQFGDTTHYVQAPPLEIVRFTQYEAAETRGPSLSMEDGMALALLNALTRWFGGTSEVLTLRRDYDAERKRVDKLTDAIIAQMARPS